MSQNCKHHIIWQWLIITLDFTEVKEKKQNKTKQKNYELLIVRHSAEVERT
jgi:hypothetical protein